jgi:hypothetical protein
MFRTKAIVGALVALLISTNLWWAYKVLDGGISYTYLTASYETSATQLSTALAIINAMAQSGASKEAIVRAAQAAAKDSEPFEKSGAVWVGQLGLRFSTEGRLTRVITIAEDTQIAVGTPITGRPPHRSERAQLRHSAPTSGFIDGITFARPGMKNSWGGQPAG